MKTAAAYIRVSTEDQTEYSPDSQLKIIRAYAKEHDMILPDEFIYADEGISGRKADKRPAFQQMIGTAKMKPKPFDVVLLWKFSRFARNRLESMTYKSVLKKNGIDVVSISEPIGDEPTAIIMEAMIEAMDEYYSINLSGEVKRGLEEKFSRGGVTSSPPFGYKVENGIFVPDKPNDSIVKMIYNDYLSGTGALKIAKKLNSMGIHTKQGKAFDKKSIDYILSNPVYIGKFRRSKGKSLNSTLSKDYSNFITVDAKHEPIISQDVFEKVHLKLEESQKIYGRYARQGESNYMLKGLLRCDACGEALHYMKVGAYQCNGYTRGTCQKSHYIKSEKIHKAILDKITSDLENNQFDIKIEPQKSESTAPDIYAVIEREKKKLLRIREAYEAGVDTLEEYKENKKKIQDGIEKLTAQAAEQVPASSKRNAKLISEKVRAGLDIIKNPKSSENDKNIALRHFIEKIVYFKPQNIIEIFYKL